MRDEGTYWAAAGVRKHQQRQHLLKQRMIRRCVRELRQRRHVRGQVIARRGIRRRRSPRARPRRLGAQQLHQPLTVQLKVDGRVRNEHAGGERFRRRRRLVHAALVRQGDHLVAAPRKLQLRRRRRRHVQARRVCHRHPLHLHAAVAAFCSYEMHHHGPPSTPQL
jgi:hypothetical protein